MSCMRFRLHLPGRAGRGESGAEEQHEQHHHGQWLLSVSVLRCPFSVVSEGRWLRSSRLAGRHRPARGPEEVGRDRAGTSAWVLASFVASGRTSLSHGAGSAHPPQSWPLASFVTLPLPEPSSRGSGPARPRGPRRLPAGGPLAARPFSRVPRSRRTRLGVAAPLPQRREHPQQAPVARRLVPPQPLALLAAVEQERRVERLITLQVLLQHLLQPLLLRRR